MIPNCRGCEQDLKWAYDKQSLGFHLAVNPFKKGHLTLVIVDDNGNILIG